MDQTTIAFQISELYVTYWGRAADPEGLEFWATYADGQINGATPRPPAEVFDEIAGQFALSDEAKGEYAFLSSPNTSNRVAVEFFVNQIYQNAFGRNAEAAGLKFWSDALQADPSLVPTFILEVINGAQNGDAVTIKNRTDIATLFTNSFSNTHNGDPFTNTTEIDVIGNGPAAGATSKTIIRSVTDVASTVTAAEAATDAFMASYLAPVYELTSVPTPNANEGQSVAFTLATTYVLPGTVLTYQLTGDINSADIVDGQLTGVITVGNDGTAAVSVSLATDALLEGNETLTLNIIDQATGLTPVASDSVEVLDVAPVYSLASNLPSVPEGGTVTFTFTTSAPVQPGTPFNYTISGVQSGDINVPLAGTLTTDAEGKAILAINVANDAVVDTETLTLSVAGQSASVSITDVPPVFTLTSNATSVLEGGTVTFTFTTSTPVQPGTPFNYTISGVQSGDINVPLAGTLTTDTEGKAVLAINISNDIVTDSETLSLSVAGQSASVTLIDVPPVFTLTPNATSVLEGGTVTFTFTTSAPVQPSTPFNYTISGVQSGDINVPLAGTLITDAEGKALLAINVLNDAVADSETLTLSVAGQSASVTVIDVPPVFTLTSSTNEIAEGGTITFTFTTSAPVQPGAPFNYTISGVQASDINIPLAGTLITDTEGKAVLAINVLNDAVADSETLTLSVAGQSASVNIINVDSGIPFALTTATDIGSSSFFAGNINTLGQNDQLTGAGRLFNPADHTGGDRLNLAIGNTVGFAVDNFTAFGVEVLEVQGFGGLATEGTIVMSNFVGTAGDLPSGFSLIEIDQVLAVGDGLVFKNIYNWTPDVQAVPTLTAKIKDSAGFIEFNFDVSYLEDLENEFNIVVDEVAVTQAQLTALNGIQGLGLFVSQDTDQADAELETLNLTSINTSGNNSTNFVNLIAFIDSGAAMRTLNIDGETSLHIVADLGGDNPSGNPGLDQPYLTTINASGLEGDLKFTYTSSVGDAEVANPVNVTLAQGDTNTASPFQLFDNIVELNTRNTGNQATNFNVIAPETSSEYSPSNDSVMTDIGNDDISVGGGYNYVNAGDGNNTVTAADGFNLIESGSGNDTITVGDGSESPKPAAKLLEGPFAGNDFVEFDNIIDAGEGNNNVTAGDGDNFITTGDGNDTVNAGNGDNVIYVGNGNNTVNAGVGQVPFGTGTNKVIAGNGVDIVNTGDGNDTIVVGDADDSAADIVNSNGGADLVITGNGNDTVDSGDDNDNVAVGTGRITVNLGQGSDALWMRANDMDNLDVVNGGTNDSPLSFDQIIFTAGGSIELTETIRVSNIEQFTLRNLSGDEVIVSDHDDVQAAFEGTIAGAQQDYFINVSNELVAQSNDNLVINGSNARRFTIDSTQARANSTVDITNVDDLLVPTDPTLFSAFRFIGGGSNERLIVRGAQVSDLLTAQLDGGNDILEILDGVTITATDLQNISGVNRIELGASNNNAQTFNIVLTDAILTANPNIVIAAINALPPGSRLNLDVTGVTAGGAPKIVVEDSANLIINIVGDPNIGNAGAKVQVITSFFLTSNSDVINGTTADDLIIADSTDTLNFSDRVDGGANGSNGDTLRFEFGVFDADLDFSTNPTTAQFALGLEFLTVSAGGTTLSDGSASISANIFALEPFFSGAFPGFLFGSPLLTQPITAVTDQFGSPVPVDSSTFPGLFFSTLPGFAPFASSSQPDVPQGTTNVFTADNPPANYPVEGIGIGALPFPGAAEFSGSTLESQLNFITVQNVEKFVFNPPNDRGVRFVYFNTQETFETLRNLQQSRLDLVSLDVLTTYDVERAPNAGNIGALIEGNGAPLNDILYLDDYSWNLDFTTKAESFWAGYEDTFVVDVAEFINPLGRGTFDLVQRFVSQNRADVFNYSRYEDVNAATTNDFTRGKVLNGSAQFALEVNTGAGNDFIRRDVFGENGNEQEPFGYLRQVNDTTITQFPGWSVAPNFVGNETAILNRLNNTNGTGTFAFTGNIADYRVGETAYLSPSGEVVSDNVRNAAPNSSEFLPLFSIRPLDLASRQWMVLNGNSYALRSPEPSNGSVDTFFAGYLVDAGSGDDVVVLDSPTVLRGLDPEFEYVESFGFDVGNSIFGYGASIEGSLGNWFSVAINAVDPFGRPIVAFVDDNRELEVRSSSYITPPFGVVQTVPFPGGEQLPGTFADDVILTRSGNDYIVDYGGDNVVYSGIGNDFVLLGLGNDFIVSDDDNELDTSKDPALDTVTNESEAGHEDFSGPAAFLKEDVVTADVQDVTPTGTDNDIILADGPFLQSFYQYTFDTAVELAPAISPVTDSPLFVNSFVFGKDYVRDLQGDNIISTGGNDDTVLTGKGNDLVFAGTFTELGTLFFDQTNTPPVNAISQVEDSDVVIDEGGNNLIVTLGDDDYVRVGEEEVGVAAVDPGANIIIAGFGADDDVVISRGDNTDWIEVGGGQDVFDQNGNFVRTFGADYVDAGAGNDLISTLLRVDSRSPINTGDTFLGGAGMDTLLFNLDGSQDDIVIAPRTVIAFGPEGEPTSVNNAAQNFPNAYNDANNGIGVVNPILNSLESFIVFSDDADIYLAQGVGQQAGGEITVFLNDLEYDSTPGNGVDIVLSAADFSTNETVNAFAFNIGASTLQNGITASAGLIGGDGDDKLTAGFFLQEGIFPDGSDVATFIDKLLPILDNQALDNFSGADISFILDTLINGLGNTLATTGLAPTNAFPFPPAQAIQDIFATYPTPEEDRVAQIQAIFDGLFFNETLAGDYVEDFITYQGNRGADIITLEPTLFDVSGLNPLIAENTPEFVRYETPFDGAAQGNDTRGWDIVRNFNNVGSSISYAWAYNDGGDDFNGTGSLNQYVFNYNVIEEDVPGVPTGTFSIDGETATPFTFGDSISDPLTLNADGSPVDLGGNGSYDAGSTITAVVGDKIVIGGGEDRLADIVSKNANQLLDLFKVDAAVNFSTGRNSFDGTLDNTGTSDSGDEALFLDQATSLSDDEITNFGALLPAINSFVAFADPGDGGLIIANGDTKSAIISYVEKGASAGNAGFDGVQANELNILAVVEGFNSGIGRQVNLKASDFIIDTTGLNGGISALADGQFIDNFTIASGGLVV